MKDGSEVSLLAAGSDELTGGFHPLRLWRDRRRILAEPAVAARPRPPLANAPMRFALALGLTPVLVVAWLASMAVALLPGERPERGGLEFRSEAVIRVLEPALGLDPAGVAALAGTIKRRQLVPEARTLGKEADGLVFFQPALDNTERGARLAAWLARLRASAVPREQQDILLAKLLDSAYDMRRGDRLFGEISRSVSEGGPMLQFMTLSSLITSAWLFGQMLRGDARFVHAERGDRFYLYYTTSRMFWFVPAQTLAYGVVSFGSASGNAALMQGGQLALFAVGGASLLWLLAGSRQMARALADAPHAAMRDAWSVAWRMVVAMTVSMIVMSMVFGLIGAAIGLGAALLP